MSQFSFVEKLLDGAEFELIDLGELSIKISSGKNKKKSTDGLYPVFGSTGIIGRTNNKVYDKDLILIARVGANAGRVNIAQGEYDVSDNTLIVENKNSIILKYLYYYLVNINLNQYAQGAGQPLITARQLKSIQIPIPCPDNSEKSLAIQTEIVRILDNFTELTTELTTELNALKKQYKYYREQLFSFEDGIADYLSMGDEEVGKFIRGGGLQKKDFTKTGIGCIHYGQIYTHYSTYASETKTFVSEEFAKKARKAKSGDLVIATTSENDEDVCKAVAWLGEADIAVSSDACIYTHSLNPKYVAYFFQTELFQKQKRQYITGIKVRRVNADNLAKILIPVPAPEKQAKIVEILDKFETLTTSINESLPREIELRQKQYEYYRNLLLSFPKKEQETV